MTLIADVVSERFVGRRRWTRIDCDILERLSALNSRYELIDGEVIEKVGQNPLHASCVMRAIMWLAGAFGADYVFAQTTLEVSTADQVTNRPEPDVFVLRRPARSFTQPPTGEDVLLVVEVSDSTLSSDLRAKAELYARAGIPEYWVLDVQSRRLFVHREALEGSYSQMTPFSEDESVSPVASPLHPVRVDTLLPEAPE